MQGVHGDVLILMFLPFLGVSSSLLVLDFIWLFLVGSLVLVPLAVLLPSSFCLSHTNRVEYWYLLDEYGTLGAAEQLGLLLFVIHLLIEQRRQLVGVLPKFDDSIVVSKRKP